MSTLTDVSTASILVRSPLTRVRDLVVRLGRECWLAPAGDGWVLVLPDLPEGGSGDEVDPFGLVGLGRALCDAGLEQVLVFSVGRGLGLSQLMSPAHETAFIGWRTEQSGEPPASRVEPDAITFCRRFGVPERAELLELLLEDHSGSAEERLAGFCVALGLPPAAIGASSARLAQERLHLPGAERHTRRGLLERWLARGFSPRPWPRWSWVLRALHGLLLAGGLAVFVSGWASTGSVVHLALGLGTVAALTGLVVEARGERRRGRTDPW